MTQVRLYSMVDGSPDFVTTVQVPVAQGSRLPKPNLIVYNYRYFVAPDSMSDFAHDEYVEIPADEVFVAAGAL